jgi:zinc resistance-associated protein
LIKLKKKYIVIAILSGLIIIAISSIAFSQGFGRGKGRYGMMNQSPIASDLTQEQIEKLQSLQLEFDKETLSLRNDIITKRLEIQKLWSADNLDENAIIAKEKEMMELRNQMQEKRLKYNINLAKILPKEQIDKIAFGNNFGNPCPRMGFGYGNHRYMGKRFRIWQ